MQNRRNFYSKVPAEHRFKQVVPRQFTPIKRANRSPNKDKEESKERNLQSVYRQYQRESIASPIKNAVQQYLQHLVLNRDVSQRRGTIDNSQRSNRSPNPERRAILQNLKMEYTGYMKQYEELVKHCDRNRLFNIKILREDLRRCTPAALKCYHVNQIKKKVGQTLKRLHLETKRFNLTDFELQKLLREDAEDIGIIHSDVKDYIITAFNIEGVLRIIQVYLDQRVGEGKVGMNYKVTHPAPTTRLPNELKITLDYEMQVRTRVKDAMDKLRLVSKIRFLTANLKRELMEAQSVRLFWESLEQQVCYLYTSQNELIVEALRHDAVDSALTRLSKLEQKLESFCEVSPISPEKFQILKEFKWNKRFEFEPAWLQEIQIIKKFKEQAVVFFGKSKQNLKKQKEYAEKIEQLDQLQISGLSSSEIDILRSIHPQAQVPKLQVVFERSQCILIGQLPSQDNLSFRFYGINADKRNQFVSELNYTIQKELPTGGKNSRIWTNTLSFTDQLKYHHYIRYFTQLKQTKLGALEIKFSELQLQIRLPMAMVNETTRELLSKPPNQVYSDKIEFEPDHRHSLVTCKDLVYLLEGKIYVQSQFQEPNFISLRSYYAQELEAQKKIILSFLRYQIQLPYKDRTFTSEEVQTLKKLIPLENKLRTKWQDFHSLDALGQVSVCEEQKLGAAAVYFLQLEATPNHKQRIIKELRNLLDSLIFNSQTLSPLNEALLNLRREDGTTIMDEVKQNEQVFCHIVTALNYELIVRRGGNYEAELKNCLEILTNLSDLVISRFQPVKTSLLTKLGVILQFERMPRYVSDLNCVLDVDLTKGLKIYSWREEDQELFYQYFKIMQQSLGAVFPFQVRSNTSELVKKKLNYENLERDYSCKMRSWLHQQSLDNSSLYVHAKGCPQAGYRKVKEKVKEKIIEKEASRQVALILCPKSLIQRVREKEVNNEKLSDITQLTQRTLSQPCWVVRKIQTQEEDQGELSQSLVWKYFQETDIQFDLKNLVEEKYQRGHTEFTQQVSILGKEFELKIILKSQSESFLKVGIKQFALKRIHQVCQLCFFKKQWLNVAESAAKFIKFIPIDWGYIVRQKLSTFLQTLSFTDVTYLQQQEGIVMKADLKQAYYLSTDEGTPQQLRKALKRIQVLARMKSNLRAEYEVLYQIKNRRSLLKFPIQIGSPQYERVQEEIQIQNRVPFIAERIQSFTALFQVNKFRGQFNEEEMKTEVVFSSGCYINFKPGQLIALQKEITPQSRGVSSTRPSTNGTSQEESKSQNIIGKYVMYQLYYTARNEQIFDYDGSDMDPAFFDSKFLNYDLILVRNRREDVYFVPKEKSQLFPLYEITF